MNDVLFLLNFPAGQGWHRGIELAPDFPSLRTTASTQSVVSMGFSDVISLSVHVGRLISIPFGQKCSAVLTNRSNTEGTPVINMFLFISFSFLFFFFLFIIIFPKVSHDLWGHGFFLGVSLPSEGLVPMRRAEAGQLRQRGGEGGRGASPAD